jgi:cytochrome c oxidase subunit 2
MPGYHNKLTVTFEKAGRYTIACLEYCGLNHHKMIHEFEVLP